MLAIASQTTGPNGLTFLEKTHGYPRGYPLLCNFKFVNEQEITKNREFLKFVCLA